MEDLNRRTVIELVQTAGMPRVWRWDAHYAAEISNALTTVQRWMAGEVPTVEALKAEFDLGTVYTKASAYHACGVAQVVAAALRVCRLTPVAPVAPTVAAFASFTCIFDPLDDPHNWPRLAAAIDAGGVVPFSETETATVRRLLERAAAAPSPPEGPQQRAAQAQAAQEAAAKAYLDAFRIAFFAFLHEVESEDDLEGTRWGRARQHALQVCADQGLVPRTLIAGNEYIPMPAGWSW